MEGERKRVTVFVCRHPRLDQFSSRNSIRRRVQQTFRSSAAGHDGRGASLRRHGQSSFGRWHHGAVWRAPWRMKITPCGRAMRRWRCKRNCAVVAPRTARCTSRPAAADRHRHQLRRGGRPLPMSNDLNIDYSALGQTTHLPTRIGIPLKPRATGIIAITADTVREDGEGFVRGASLWARSSKSRAFPTAIEAFELTGATAAAQSLARRPEASWTYHPSSDAGLRLAFAPANVERKLPPVMAGSWPVVGEAGMGKSRLVLRQFLESHVSLRDAACLLSAVGVLWQGHALFPGDRIAADIF